MITTKGETEPWRLLAASIIAQAKDDLSYRGGRGRNGPHEERSAVRASARRFLLSEECRGLCEMLDRDYGPIAAHVNSRPEGSE